MKPPKYDYKSLREICGNLSTISPNTSTVEEDFSVFIYENNNHKESLMNISLEVITQSKKQNIIQ